MKPFLPRVTLIAVDTGDKPRLSILALNRALEQCDFGAMKFLTNRSDDHGMIKIPKLQGLEGYSRFMIREIHKYVETSHALVVQWDGFPLRGEAWTDEFLDYDYGGAPFQPSDTVGNGGFSWRSKRLLEACSKLPEGSDHPEDSCISIRFRKELEAQGMKFMPPKLARQFSFEGRAYDGVEWKGVPNKWDGAFGFHSLLSVLPPEKKPFKVFHHSLDQGDCVYAMAAMKALGGGALFISPDNKFPYPLNSRWARMGGEAATVDNLRPLIEAQDYVVSCRYTHGTPFSTDYDLNRFRIPWRNRTARDFDSILKLHMDAFSLPMPTQPWLTVTEPIVVPGRPIVVNRTERYQDLLWPWTAIIKKHHKQMVFVGTYKEYESLCGMAPEFKFDYYGTKDALELARVIAGAKLFIGNQSLALAIAHGLGKQVLVEEWALNANCRIERPGAYYKLTEEMLK
jgi:hypothetical protein